MGPGGLRRLQNGCEALSVSGGFDSHALPPPRIPRVTTALSRVVLALLLTLPSRAALAQRADSAQVFARPRTIDSVTHATPLPPITPRRAFLYSLALPGYSQSILGRPTAGAIFVLTETIAIAMLRESSADLREARRFRTDSLVVLGTDPTTGAVITQRSGYNDALINVRKGHVEDWVAFLLANHLFAAADGYVAAHLWDLPSQVSVRAGPNGTVLAARLHW